MLLGRLRILLLLLLLCCILSTAAGVETGNALTCVEREDTQGVTQLCQVMAGTHFVTTCSPKVSTLILQFKVNKTTWPADGGLNNCYSVTHLKVIGWSGPELTSEHLGQLVSLTSVIVTDGDLMTVGPEISTNSLSELILARNKITSIHDRSLDQCASLVSLDLSHNSIDHLASRLLTNCRSLRSLQLTGNRLTELQSDTLRGAVNLYEVVLQNNSVKRLNNVELAFSNNPKVTLIDLRDNKLLFYRPGTFGFCGPTNVTVRMHFAGCPPAASRSGGSCDGVNRLGLQCVGTSARLIVTFTSCQVSIGEPSSCHPRAVSISPKRTPEVRKVIPADPTVTPGPSSTSQTALIEQNVQSLILRRLGILPEGVWLLYALVSTVVLCLALLTVFLCVFHRLKLKIALLQARDDALGTGAPSLRRFQTIRSQSLGFSGRATPSGRDQSSHCGGEGASQCCVGDVAFEQPLIPLETHRMLDGCSRYPSARLDAEEETDRKKLGTIM